ncbi:hypothetical protein ACF0H5_024516 [Mactra antiquata]
MRTETSVKIFGILTLQTCFGILQVLSQFVNPNGCPKDFKCPIQCPNGYQLDSNGCKVCQCIGTSADMGLLYNPCPGAAPTCDMFCPDGYQRGTNGCHVCECQAVEQETTSVVSRTTTLSHDECIMKITECQLQYPFGFMTDDSCVLCISKDDIYPPYIPIERQPMIRLSNPCIQGFDMCRIFCATGYRKGERSCQYCACNG